MILDRLFLESTLRVVTMYVNGSLPNKPRSKRMFCGSLDYEFGDPGIVSAFLIGWLVIDSTKGG